MLTILGSIFAVAAVAIAEAFVPAGLLVLTQGEYEALAAILYFVAIILYFGTGRSR